MPNNEGGEKTEKASPKKRQDERKKGNIFMSKDIPAVVGILISFYMMKAFFGSFFDQLQDQYIRQIRRAAEMEFLDIETVGLMGREVALLIGTTLLPAMLVIMVVAVLSVGAQTKFIFSGETMKFKMDRLNPLQGIKRMISLKGVVELLKSLIKIMVLAWLLYGSVQQVIEILPAMMDWEVLQGMSYTGQQILSMVISAAIAFGAIAVLDYLYQRWEYEKGIMMTKHEVKMEYKQMEGDPQIKGKIREKQREFANKRMMQQVKEADVIVRNPTHFAVALKYSIETDIAPRVLAKGQDIVALRIVEEAAKYNIPAVENKPLARGLYESAEVDETIPAEFFQAVAELLAWLYNSKDKESVKR
ncbi:flagellar biosynthesis protein FlhB [Oscillospiraceae bacterium MB08-C2-2]|nr:flagellar biosynthesis protein FlhB [Oscillospiraceae bacterium MB08-C2-2]